MLQCIPGASALIHTTIELLFVKRINSQQHRSFSSLIFEPNSSMQRLGACNGLKHTPAFHNEAVCRPCRNVHRARTAFRCVFSVQSVLSHRACCDPITTCISTCRPFCSGDQQQQNAQRLQHLQHATACRSGHSTAPLIGQQDCNTGRRHMLASAAVLAGLAISSPPVRAEPGQDLDLTITDRASGHFHH